MKKHSIVAVLVIVLISLLISIGLECNLIQANGQKEFYVNILIGIFSGGILTLVLLGLDYINERKGHNVFYLEETNKLISYSLMLIEYFEKEKQADDCFFNGFIEISKCSNEIKNEMLKNNYFRYSKLDKLVESILLHYGRMASLLIYYQDECKRGHINEAFFIARQELIESYKPEFEKYKKLLDVQSKLILKDRNLEKYM